MPLAASRPRRVQSHPIVDDQHTQLTIARADVDPNRLGLRVPDAVRHRLLNDAIDAGAMLVGQRCEVAVHPKLRADRIAAREVADVPFQRGLQPEVVEHARTEAEREIANRAHHVVHEVAALGDG